MGALGRLSLEERRKPLPDADAHRRDAVASVPTLELAQEGPREAGAGGSDRVTDRDRATVGVGAVVRQPERADAGEHLRGEGLVELDRVALVHRHTSPLDELRHRRDRSKAHVIRVNAGGCARDDAPERLQTEGARLLSRGDDERGGTVVDPRRIAGGDGAVLAERGLQLCELLDRRVGAGMLVIRNELLAVVHRLDLAGEESIRP